MKKSDLIKFENEIAALFDSGKIKSPIHLQSNNESFLINFFKRIKKKDWIFCSWRSHYHCLLKGVPQKKLKKEILNGKSISLCFPEYRIYSSALVGGILPIAVGLALSFKRKKSSNKVYCFIGGMAHETIKFSINKKLPIHFIIEDNRKSVCSDTRKTWSQKKLTYENFSSKYITYYKYKLTYPHAGSGKRVQF